MPPKIKKHWINIFSNEIKVDKDNHINENHNGIFTQGVVYRFITENVWLKNEKFEEMRTAFRQWNDTGDQEVMKKQRKLFVKSLLDTFFHRGTEGLELANYFADTPNPYTAKKIRAIRGQFLQSFMFLNYHS